MTPAVRKLLDKPDQHFAPKKVYGKQSSEDDEDDEDDKDTRLMSLTHTVDP